MRDWTLATCFMVGAILGLLVSVLAGWQFAAAVFVSVSIGTAVAYAAERLHVLPPPLRSAHSGARG